MVSFAGAGVNKVVDDVAGDMVIAAGPPSRGLNPRVRADDEVARGGVDVRGPVGVHVDAQGLGRDVPGVVIREVQGVIAAGIVRWSRPGWIAGAEPCPQTP